MLLSFCHFITAALLVSTLSSISSFQLPKRNVFHSILIHAAAEKVSSSRSGSSSMRDSITSNKKRTDINSQNSNAFSRICDVSNKSIIIKENSLKKNTNQVDEQKNNQDNNHDTKQSNIQSNIQINKENSKENNKHINRVILGDSRLVSTYTQAGLGHSPLLELADILVTDPPYCLLHRRRTGIIDIRIYMLT